MAALRAATPADPSAVAAPNREFALSATDFQTLTRLAYEYAGIALAESKQNLIYSRLSRRLRALRLGSFSEYCDYLTANASEVENFINSISTNHTKFFREAHHFEHFRATSQSLLRNPPPESRDSVSVFGRPAVRAARSRTPSRWYCTARFAILLLMMSAFWRLISTPTY